MKHELHLLTVVGGVLFLTNFAQAQTAGTPGSLPGVFLGAGVAVGTTDAESRMRLWEPPGPQVWLIEGGLALWSRVGIGAEFTQVGKVSTTTTGISFRSSGTQRERTVVGVARVRALARDRWRLDVLGGGGALFQHHERAELFCDPGRTCGSVHTETLQAIAPVIAFGADLPLEFTRHIAVSGLIRYYVLRRGNHLSDYQNYIPWQYEWTSSTRWCVGATVRAMW